MWSDTIDTAHVYMKANFTNWNLTFHAAYVIIVSLHLNLQCEDTLKEKIISRQYEMWNKN